MTEPNLAAILYNEKDVRVEEQPITEPGQGEVQISMRNVGICGTDVHFWQRKAVGTTVVTGPIVLGHEGSGVITKVGQGVTQLKVGDRVVIEPLVPCKHCDVCRTGRYNLCSTRIFCAAFPTHGFFRRFHVHDADFCYKLPDHVSLEEAALVEPLSVAVHSCSLAEVKLGSKVLICGAGPIGFTSLLVAIAFGATEATKPGGCVALAGLRSNEAVFPLAEVVLKQIKMIGVAIYANRFPTTLEMLASGKYDVKPLITHRFNLRDIAEAFETAHSGQGIKVIVECGKD